MPNSLAFLMLLIWPLVVAGLFMRLRPDLAFVWSVVGGYLVLPPVAAFGLPLLPDLDKMSIPVLAAFAAATLLRGERIRLVPRSGAARLLVALFLLAPFGTALTNPDPIRFSPDTGGFGGPGSGLADLPGLTLYDGLSMMLRNAFVLLTFAMARHFLASAAALRGLLSALVLAGLAYSLPMLVEVRLSPQLNVWVYGFFQHSWEQMVRQGGFRPIVFLEHGLWVAFFALTSLFAALGLARTEPAGRQRWLAAAVYLAAVLVLCKSMGVLVFAATLGPLLLFASDRRIVRLAAAAGAAVFLYPVLRANGLVPVEALIDAAAAFSAERAYSLEFRLVNEAVLLDHALERPWFGWGDWQRNLVFDPALGRLATISDGRWVIVFGVSGWAGYAAEFGLLLLPLVMLARGAAPVPAAAVPLAVIQAANLIDLIPNATLTPITWLVTGALLATAERRAAGIADGIAGAVGASAPAPQPRARTVI